MNPLFAPLSGTVEQPLFQFLQDVLQGDEPYLTTELIVSASAEVSLYHGQRSVEELRPLRPFIFTRAWARMNANAGTRPRAETRVDVGRQDVSIQSKQIPYSYFFALDYTELTHKSFDGGRSGTMGRAAFLMADAVTVLPYDPVRDRVLVIEQFRFGPYARGDARPWMIEPIAGRVDPGEGTPATAHREAMEEAGLNLTDLHLVAEYYPSSGAITEYVTAYLGIADLPDESAGRGGGLEAEHEDIASYLLSFDQLMEMCDQSQLDVGPLYISALWLARHRDRIRREAGV